MCKEEHCQHSDAENPFGKAEFTPLADTGRCCVNSKPQREPGFYWVKIDVDTWSIAMWSGQHWRFIGAPVGGLDDKDLLEIDERRIERQPVRNELLTPGFLQDMHPELTHDLAMDLMVFCHSQTITHKGCYGDGSIIYPLWKAQLPK